MDLNQIVQSFKNEYLKADEAFPFSLLPLLLDSLIKQGLNVSNTDSKFYRALATEVFSGESSEVQAYGVDALFVISQNIPLPTAPVISDHVPAPKTTNTEAIIDGDIIRTDHLINNIPNEDDEGDPLYTAPENRINLRPEDCEPMHIDHEFMASLGAKGYGQ